MLGKLGLDKTVEVMAKSTNDLVMSFEVAARRAKKDQPNQQ